MSATDWIAIGLGVALLFGMLLGCVVTWQPVTERERRVRAWLAHTAYLHEKTCQALESDKTPNFLMRRVLARELRKHIASLPS